MELQTFLTATPTSCHILRAFIAFFKVGRCEHVAVAGLFHSIYGTNAFSGFGLGLDHRPEIRNLIW